MVLTEYARARPRIFRGEHREDRDEGLGGCALSCPGGCVGNHRG